MIDLKSPFIQKNGGNMKNLRSNFGKKLTGFALAGLISVGMLGVAAPAEATPGTTGTSSNPSSSELNEVRDVFSKFSIPVQQQDDLIQKALNGVAWDVYNPANEPVTVEDDQVIGNMNYTIKRYADGSVAASGMEIPVEVSASLPNVVQPFALSQCKVASGSGYRVFTGCQIDGWWGNVRVGAANISYSLINGAYDSISNPGYGFQSCLWPLNCTSPVLVLNSPYETGQGPAYIKWQSDVSGAGSWNVWVRLTVGGDAAWDSTS